SFKIWFNACPICKSPFAYGGPSCKINNGLPSVRCCTFSYKFISSHCFCRRGSLFVKFPRIGNFVFGINNVLLYRITFFLLIYYLQKQASLTQPGIFCICLLRALSLMKETMLFY